MEAPDWLVERLAETPEPLRRELATVVEELDASEDLADGFLAAAGRRLESVYGRLGDRESAFDLLAADGLLTFACEAAAVSDPAHIAERCQAMGPSGRLGELAGLWARRS